MLDKKAIQRELDFVANDLDAKGLTDYADRVDVIGLEIQSLSRNRESRAKARALIAELRAIEAMVIHLQHEPD